MGQSKNVMSDFMKKNKPTGTSFQDGMLKLVRTLPKVRPAPKTLRPPTPTLTGPLPGRHTRHTGSP